MLDQNNESNSSYKKLTDELISLGNLERAHQRHIRLKDASGNFLMTHRKKYGQKAVDIFFDRLRHWNPAEQFSFTPEELDSLAISVKNAFPKGPERTRRVFLAATATAGFALLGFGAKTTANKVAPIPEKEVNALRDRGIEAQQAPLGSWTRSMHESSANTLQWTGSISYVWAVKKGVDTYFLYKKGHTVSMSKIGEDIGNNSIVLHLKNDLDTFLFAAAKEHGIIPNNSQPTPLQ